MALAATKRFPPKPKGHWLFGPGYNFGRDSISFIMENCPKYDGIFYVDTTIKKIMIVNKPDYIKYILQDNNRNYVKSFGYEVLKLLLGNGLLTSEGEFWRKQRRLAQPAFHREKLASLAATMTDCIQEQIDNLESEAPGKRINIAKHTMALALNVVARSLFSSYVEDVIETVAKEMDIANEAAVNRIRNPFKLPIWFPTSSNLKERRSIEALGKIVMDIIESRRRSGEELDDLMGMLMSARDEETGERMSDLQLKDEAITIFLAGHETTALALAWLWYCLSQNSEVEERVYKEVTEVLDGRTPEITDLPKLKYSKKVIEETMRLYPPVWIVGRKTREDDEIGGYLIPKGTNILMPTYYVHRDPQLWDDPESFRPDRFEAERVKERHRYAYFPFGGGPRLCIGNNFAMMEMQLALAMMIRKFRFRLSDGFEPEIDALITLRTKEGMMMDVEMR